MDTDWRNYEISIRLDHHSVGSSPFNFDFRNGIFRQQGVSHQCLCSTVDSSTAFKGFLRRRLAIMRLLLAILWTIAAVLRACKVAD